MKKNVLLFFAVGVQLLFLVRWQVCTSFVDFFHFSKASLLMHLDIVIHNDAGIAVSLVRFFHNKPVVFLQEVTNAYFHFGNGGYLITVTSFVGLLGIAAALWHLMKTPRKNGVYLFLLFLTAPFIEIFFYQVFPFSVRFFLLGLSYLGVSFYGNKQILKYHPRGWIFLIGAIMLSLWWYSIFSNELGFYCIQ